VVVSGSGQSVSGQREMTTVQAEEETEGALSDHLSQLAGGIDRHANVTHASGLLY